ncbi:uncharacterized protein LOC124316779 [Daphnia pulicaria]|uniref:uncharacterized protein LOC124316779 n=1 Tax=Daphnia pulicaria TaxID=35523 RepID=UPI001EEB3CD0|nr:uncharacterized protein LOC124316779 [Daphnia pulicaria]
MASIKLLLIVASIIATCAAFPSRILQTNNRKSSRELENVVLNNTVELDPEGTFRLDWDIVYDQDPANPLVVMEMRVATAGWFSLRFTSADLTLGDYFYGAYDVNKPANSFFLDKHCDLVDGLGCETADGPSDDLRNDFQLISLVNGLDYTVMRIARVVDTGHLQDVVITPGPMMLGWAWSTGIQQSGLGNQLTPIEKFGFQNVALIPAK